MTGLVDITVQLVNDQKTDIFGTSLLRFCRLIRLVRIVKAGMIPLVKTREDSNIGVGMATNRFPLWSLL